MVDDEVDEGVGLGVEVQQLLAGPTEEVIREVNINKDI